MSRLNVPAPEFVSLVPAGDAAGEVASDLKQRYAEPHRFYHTLEHVHRVLGAARALAENK